jgi:hypothetical protein
LFALRDPSAALVARMTTWSPTANVFDVALISVTEVLGGTVIVCEPPAYWTTYVDPFALATLPFDIRD